MQNGELSQIQTLVKKMNGLMVNCFKQTNVQRFLYNMAMINSIFPSCEILCYDTKADLITDQIVTLFDIRVHFGQLMLGRPTIDILDPTLEFVKGSSSNIGLYDANLRGHTINQSVRTSFEQMMYTIKNIELRRQLSEIGGQGHAGASIHQAVFEKFQKLTISMM